MGAKLTAAFGSLGDVEVVLAAGGGNPSDFKQRLGDYWKALLQVADASLKSLQAQAEETLRLGLADIARHIIGCHLFF